MAAQCAGVASVEPAARRAQMMPMQKRIDPSIFDGLPLGRDPASVRVRIEAMERLLERLFIVPGINRPVGLDTLIGVVPVAGDLVGAGLGAWMVWEARNLGLSKFTLARMAGNVGFDAVIGAVPLQHAQPTHAQAAPGQASPRDRGHRGPRQTLIAVADATPRWWAGQRR